VKRLMLMRHAKSSWENPNQRDHDRPLNARGRRAAKALGQWLKMDGHYPEQVFCSTSARAIETYERLNMDADVQHIAKLYHANTDQILQVIKTARAPSLMVIGHSPGIASLARTLMATPPAHGRFFDYPTSATLIADFKVDAWEDIHPQQSVLVNFVTPRDITQ